MIKFEAEDLAVKTQHPVGGWRIQGILEECNESSRAMLLEKLLDPEIGNKTIEKMLRPILVDTRWYNVSADSVYSWRENKSHWESQL